MQDTPTQPPHRHLHRLQRHDYAQPGAYFVTICTHLRICLFGRIIDDSVHLNDCGRIVVDQLVQTGNLRPRVNLDSFVVMPNHIHAVFILTDGPYSSHPDDAVVSAEQFGHPTSDSIPTLVRLTKSASTGRINAVRNTPGQPVWQRGYYEHVIRNDGSLDRIRDYVATNPTRWALDRENLLAVPPARGHTPVVDAEPWMV